MFAFLNIERPTSKFLTALQNSLDIDSIARKPAPEAKFQVSQAPGCAEACRIQQE